MTENIKRDDTENAAAEAIQVECLSLILFIIET